VVRTLGWLLRMTSDFVARNAGGAEGSFQNPFPLSVLWTVIASEMVVITQCSRAGKRRTSTTSHTDPNHAVDFDPVSPLC
jgi:hypothetical protein